MNLFLAAAPKGIYNPALSEIVGQGEGLTIINLFLGNLIGLLFAIGVLVAFVVLIIGAIQWMTAGNDKTQMESARGKVISALIGLVVLFAVFAIIKVIGALFGIEQLEDLFLDLSPFLLLD